MGKKGLTSILYKIRDVPRPSWASSSSARHYYFCYPPPPSSWPWPSCKHPRTTSFRFHSSGGGDAIYKTVNTVYDDAPSSSEHFLRRPSLEQELDRSCFPAPAAAMPEEEEQEMAAVVVRGVRSDRLLFEPGGATSSSIMVEKTRRRPAAPAPKRKAEGAVVVTVESEDPYGDFRASMAEMVAAQGLRGWEALEELLAWYLKLNAKETHGVIVAAFVDLLVCLAAASTASSSSSPSSPSRASSSCITFEEYSCVTLEEISEES